MPRPLNFRVKKYDNISVKDTKAIFCFLLNLEGDVKYQSVRYRLQKKPISHFSGQLWKSELRNENIFIPFSVAISSASFH